MKSDKCLRQLGGVNNLAHRKGIIANGTDNGETIGIPQYFDKLRELCHIVIPLYSQGLI